jgi:hypothetical protein
MEEREKNTSPNLCRKCANLRHCIFGWTRIQSNREQHTFRADLPRRLAAPTCRANLSREIRCRRKRSDGRSLAKAETTRKVARGFQRGLFHPSPGDMQNFDAGESKVRHSFGGSSRKRAPSTRMIPSEPAVFQFEREPFPAPPGGRRIA